MNFAVVTVALIYNVYQRKWAVGETVQCEPIRYILVTCVKASL